MHVCRLTPAHADLYRIFMLEAYDETPAAFIATVAERAALPASWWVARVLDAPDAEERVFGAFVGEALAGVAGLRFEPRPRMQHKATLFGMAVRPTFRGRGVAQALVQAVLEEARATQKTRVVQLRVVETNASALALYASCGFQPYGTEPLALQIDGRYEAVVYMWHAIDGAL